MTFYDDGSGVPDRVLDVVEEAPLLDGRELAQDPPPVRGGEPWLRPESTSVCARLGGGSTASPPQISTPSWPPARWSSTSDPRPTAEPTASCRVPWWSSGSTSSGVSTHSPDRLPGAVRGRRVIVVCNEGYASTFAAAALLDLGIDGCHRPGRGLPRLGGAGPAPPRGLRPHRRAKTCQRVGQGYPA